MAQIKTNPPRPLFHTELKNTRIQKNGIAKQGERGGNAEALRGVGGIRWVTTESERTI